MPRGIYIAHMASSVARRRAGHPKPIAYSAASSRTGTDSSMLPTLPTPPALPVPPSVAVRPCAVRR
eukprot:scaffold6871_cov75-Phaeocystis_antarctica.AAC.11